ncbi:MAG: hypothetical protein WC694_01220 [Candidatus Paceibacterota bacterium]|jgi:hypothetical protein
MQIKDIFNVGPVGSMGRRLQSYLNGGNCQIINKTLNEDRVDFRLRRESDGMEGDSFIKVRDEFKERNKELLNWIFVNKEIMGLTIDQLAQMETNLKMEIFNGHVQIK